MTHDRNKEGRLYLPLLLLFLGLVVGNDAFGDLYRTERDVFLTEKRGVPVEAWVANQCHSVVTKDKVQQMLQASDPFLYSEASLVPGGSEDVNLPFDAQLVSGDDYTRLAFLLRTDLTHNDTRAFQHVVKWVAAPVTGGCSSESNGDCGSERLCTLLEPPFQVDIAISKARVEYGMDEVHMQSVVDRGHQRIEPPFLYYPLDDNDLAASCMGVVTSEVRCVDGTTEYPCVLGDLPCEPSTIPDVVDPMVIESHCGAKSDPPGVFETELNQRCVVHCCPGATHRRWAVGPPAHLFRTHSTPTLIADITVTVTQLIPGGQAHTVELKDVRSGNYVVHPSAQVRVIVNDILGNLAHLAPSLNDGMFVVWDAGETNGHITQTSDPTQNPYPASSLGLTPTRRNLGTEFGWAFLNSSTTALWGTGGAYGSMQAYTTSLHMNGVEFGREAACTDTSYTDYIGVPGWEQPSEERPESLCRITHHLNDLMDQVVGAPNASAIDISALPGYYYLPPGYNLAQPNMYIYNGKTLVWELFPETLEQYPNLHVHPELSMHDSFVDDLPRFTSTYTEIYVDVSNAFSGLGQTIGKALYTPNGNTCVVELSPAGGFLYLSIVNPGNEQIQYVVQNSCSSNGTDLVVDSQPDDIPVTADKLRTVTRILPFDISATNSTNGTSVVTCTSVVSDINKLDESLDTVVMQCKVRDGSLIKDFMDVKVDEADDGFEWWQGVIIGVLGIAVLGGVAGVVYALYSTTKRKKEEKEDK